MGGSPMQKCIGYLTAVSGWWLLCLKKTQMQQFSNFSKQEKLLIVLAKSRNAGRIRPVQSWYKVNVQQSLKTGAESFLHPFFFYTCASSVLFRKFMTYI